MQRTSRFLCSTASESSNSDITVRTSKRSGTSSIGGDSLAADRESGSADYASKRKARSAKCSMRLLRSNLKSLRKPAKPGRAQRPNFRNLQNTVVLAPFHSLKKCFQTKLVNLYSFEMMKNISHKTQKAKKNNTSFEYDIIELNSSKPMVKREGRAVKKMKQKSKCANYCQCKKAGWKAEKKVSLKNSKRGRKKTKKRLQAPCLSEYLKIKKRKLNGEVMLKTELAPAFGCYQPNDQLIFSQANLSSSAKNSQSKCGSLETCSNPLTCKEQHMEGSLAVSTTSFDSYSERFDKKNWSHSDSSRRYRRRGKCQNAVERVGTNILPKLNANSSKHLILDVDTKSRDGQTVDFIDGEPQIQMISSMEPNQHLQQLQRQNKAKAKKPKNEALTGYYLRSASSSKEKIIQKENQELQEQRSSVNTFKHTALQIEVATQVEGNILEKKSSTSSLKTGQESTSNVHYTSLNISSDETPQKPPLSSSQKSESSPRIISDMKLTCDTPYLPGINPPQSQVTEDIKNQRSEGLSISGEHSDRAPMELIASMSEQLPGPTNSQQSQGKETDFIFGSKNTATRLGESCEFSFGLNWVFSDDDED